MRIQLSRTARPPVTRPPHASHLPAACTASQPVRRGQRGAAAVEFALVVPVLLLLVLGIAEFGRAYNIQTTLAGAAREGVRSLALGGDAGAARTATRTAAPTLDLTDGEIAVSAECPTGPTDDAETATVTVTYQMSLVTNLLATRSFTLTGVGVMRCNG